MIEENVVSRRSSSSIYQQEYSKAICDAALNLNCATSNTSGVNCPKMEEQVIDY